MNLKQIVLAVLIVIFLGMMWRFQWHRQKGQDLNTKSLVLPSDDNQKIVVDPSAHTISVTDIHGTRTQFLPGMRPSSVELRKNGDVVVTAKTMGVEHEFVAGIGVASDGLRFAGGVDLAYWRNFDLGVILSDSTKDLTKPRISIILSYSVWHNTQISVGVDHTGSPNLFLTERF